MERELQSPLLQHLTPSDALPVVATIELAKEDPTLVMSASRLRLGLWWTTPRAARSSSSKSSSSRRGMTSVSGRGWERMGGCNCTLSLALIWKSANVSKALAVETLEANNWAGAEGGRRGKFRASEARIWEEVMRGVKCLIGKGLQDRKLPC